MARAPRNAADDLIYHVLNRGNCRMNIFEKDGDFKSFIKLLEEGRQRMGMRVLGYCLMGNHWHLVLWPRRAKDLSRFIGWVCTTHVRRWRAHRRNAGEGHVYQGRFKSFAVQDDAHFLTLMRYVEANPLRAGMVTRAQAWPWSSLTGAPGADGVKVQLTPWPVARPDNWADIVNRAMDGESLGHVQTSLKRNRPFGGPMWTTRTAARLNLQTTMRDPWRPKIKPAIPPRGRAK
jgi:putative transposase